MTANEIRNEIFELLKRAPASISEAGVQKVRDFKKAADDAKKAALAGKPSLARLQTSLNNLKFYYEESK